MPKVNHRRRERVERHRKKQAKRLRRKNRNVPNDYQNNDNEFDNWRQQE
ncbi:hypothetical protein KY334_05190 [Candidatus Woesearchaeota archaeon]|nr:hypothetical protein [Candidatus Woesearchaeota archaeon]